MTLIIVVKKYGLKNIARKIMGGGFIIFSTSCYRFLVCKISNTQHGVCPQEQGEN